MLLALLSFPGAIDSHRQRSFRATKNLYPFPPRSELLPSLPPKSFDFTHFNFFFSSEQLEREVCGNNRTFPFLHLRSFFFRNTPLKCFPSKLRPVGLGGFCGFVFVFFFFFFVLVGVFFFFGMGIWTASSFLYRVFFYLNSPVTGPLAHYPFFATILEDVTLPQGRATPFLKPCRLLDLLRNLIYFFVFFCGGDPIPPFLPNRFFSFFHFLPPFPGN